MSRTTSRSAARPAASSEVIKARMERQARRDTKPEIELRRALHRLGLRYRLQAPAVPGLRRRVDLTFPGPRVAVDVRGCFWHSCPLHATVPKANREWWQEKLDANHERDQDTELRLRLAGWLVVVVWEHEVSDQAAQRIRAAVTSRSAR
jgi:DNA mismatch endonuclease (patch repair protein)